LYEEVQTVIEKKDENFPFAQIREAVLAVRYGYVNIVIQDGRIVQIDKTEKIRLPSQAKEGGAFKE
jgi:hypothetical protein